MWSGFDLGLFDIVGPFLYPSIVLEPVLYSNVTNLICQEVQIERIFPIFAFSSRFSPLYPDFSLFSWFLAILSIAIAMFINSNDDNIISKFIKTQQARAKAECQKGEEMWRSAIGNSQKRVAKTQSTKGMWKKVCIRILLRGYCTPGQFLDCFCIFLKNYNTLVTSKICFL